MTTSEFYARFSSATVAGGANQFFFSAPQEIRTVAFYRINYHEKANYSLLFTSVIDSTFAEWSKSHAGDLCGNFEVSELSLAVTDREGEQAVERVRRPLTVYGKTAISVAPGESFVTDPVALAVAPGEYLAISMTVKGDRIPCHPENLIPTYHITDNGLVPSKKVYLPSMVGADFPAALRIGFIGDSITQGIGCPQDSDLHYPAVCAKKLADRCDFPLSFWNLGIGYGNGADFATDGSWAEKAKHCDIVTVCYGVNDIFRVPDKTEIHLAVFRKIMKILKDARCRIVLQAIPPFDFQPELEKTRCQINEQLMSGSLSGADLLFDETQYLSSSDDPGIAVYGGHPDPAGCAVWGEKLTDVMLPLIRSAAKNTFGQCN